MRFESALLPCAVAVALLCAPGGDVDAADGRIPVFEVPTTIDAPGSYYLTRDLRGAPGSPIVTIDASDVTLDLAGHTIEHQAGTHPAIGSSGAPTNVEIFGGRIVGGLHGVHLLNVAGPSFDVSLHGLTIKDVAGSGIYIEGGFEVNVPSRVIIEQNLVADVGGHGIRVYAVDAGRIVGNTIRDAGGSGIYTDGSLGMFVADNTSASNTGHGILSTSTIGMVVEGNQLLQNEADGLKSISSRGLIVKGNLLVRNDGYGMSFETSGGHNCYADNYPETNGLGVLDKSNDSAYNVEPCSSSY
jgi:hypothetical protein